MPPVLDPENSKVDGLAFLGLSLAQNTAQGHPDSETHQSAFDLNKVLDREYEFVRSTNDDGWLVGGGEAGPPTSYKLAAKDSAHVEVMRIGTYRKDWGGLPQEEIVEAMKSGEIMIPQIEVLPTAVIANPDKPPELEIRFDMEPQIPNFDDDKAPLPVNWQLRFLHNQFFKKFVFPSRFCPGPFHSTILRKAEFRSEEAEAAYFSKCEEAINEWRKDGPQPLNTVKRDLHGKPVPIPEEPKEHPPKPHEKPHHPPHHHKPKPHEKEEEKHDDAKPKPHEKHDEKKPKPTPPHEKKEEKPDEAEPKEEKDEDVPSDEEVSAAGAPEPTPENCNSGIWLFTDRENITHFFEPNFLPPYNTPEKRKIIMDVLKEEWCEETMSWKPCGEGSFTKKPEEPVVAERALEKNLNIPSIFDLLPALKKLTVAQPKPEVEERALEVTETEKEGESKPVTGEKPEGAKPEEATNESVEVEIASSHPLVEKLDEVVGEILNHLRVCCAPGSAAFLHSAVDDEDIPMETEGKTTAGVEKTEDKASTDRAIDSEEPAKEDKEASKVEEPSVEAKKEPVKEEEPAKEEEPKPTEPTQKEESTPASEEEPTKVAEPPAEPEAEATTTVETTAAPFEEPTKPELETESESEPEPDVEFEPEPKQDVESESKVAAAAASAEAAAEDQAATKETEDLTTTTTTDEALKEIRTDESEDVQLTQ